jgi:glycosyltransferase involved in cell wall biosynthesis
MHKEIYFEQEAWAVERVGRVNDRLQSGRLPANRLIVEIPWLEEVTAFTAPGRYIYFSRRLYERCYTDEQVAFVIAHELAHHDLGHVNLFAGWAPNLREHATRIPSRLFGPVSSRIGLPRVEWLAGGGDLVLATNYLPPPTRSRGVVLVVHDLAFDTLPETAPHHDERWHRAFDRWLRAAAAVIVPSDATRSDLLAHHTVDGARVHVVAHGTDADAFRPASPLLSGKRNDAGRMPATVCGRPSSEIVRPTSPPSAANRRLQSESVRITTRSRPGASSSSRKSRPSAGRTPRVLKKSAETRAPSMRSGSLDPVRFSVSPATAERPSKDRHCLRHSVKCRALTGSDGYR